MKTEVVKKLSPLDRLVYWITEREAVRLKKEAGEPAPWTDDEILQRFKFTNVRRMDDRVSRWLLTNWYEPNRDHPNMTVACLLARQLNNESTLAEVGFPKRWDPNRVLQVLDARRARGERNFSAAYMITGTLGGTKAEQVVWKVVDPLAKDRPRLDTSSMRETWSRLVGRSGMQSFMAGQVVADLRWAVTGSWSDKDDWAPTGPGSKRGMNILQGRETEAPLPQNLFLEELRILMSHARAKLPGRITNRLEAMDYQNVLCEMSGYEKVLWGRGRKKQLYPGGGT